MTYKHYLLMGFMLVFSVAVGLYLRHQNDAEVDVYRTKAKALDRFCTGTRLTLESDARDLEGDNPQFRNYAADRISTEIIRHGFMSVETCLGKKTPPNLCQRSSDYACMAKQVRAYHDALVKAGW